MRRHHWLFVAAIAMAGVTVFFWLQMERMERQRHPLVAEVNQAMKEVREGAAALNRLTAAATEADREAMRTVNEFKKAVSAAEKDRNAIPAAGEWEKEAIAASAKADTVRTEHAAAIAPLEEAMARLEKAGMEFDAAEGAFYTSSVAKWLATGTLVLCAIFAFLTIRAWKAES